MDRRTFLSTATGSALGGLAGCSGIASDTSPTSTSESTPSPTDRWYVRPDADPVTVPRELSCPSDEFTRHRAIPRDYRVEWGSVGALELRTSDRSATYGDTVRVELTNTASEPVETGNRRKFTVELYTDAGWQPVRGTTRDTPIVYTDEAIRHQPGKGFSWELPVTETSLAHAGKDLTVCPDLVSGRYRFAYWGLIAKDAAVAVAFDLETDS